MHTFETDLLVLVQHYAIAYAAATNPENHPLTRTRENENSEYLYGLILAKYKKDEPPFKSGDVVKLRLSATSAIGGRPRLNDANVSYVVKRMVYSHGFWFLETDPYGESARFYAFAFEKK